MAPLKLDKLPVIGYLLKWFKTDDPVIDNDLFRCHHQVGWQISPMATLFSLVR